MGACLGRARFGLVMAVLGAFVLLWILVSCTSSASKRPVDGRLSTAGVSLQGETAIQEYRDETLPGNKLSALPTCEEGQLVATAENDMGARARWEVLGSVPEVSARILTDYREAGTFELAFDGYLDLFGAVWGCVVAFEGGWSEVVLVDGRSESDTSEEEPREVGTCAVTVVRLGQEQMRQAESG